MILYSQESAQTYGEIVFGYILNINQETEYILSNLGIYALAFGIILFFSAKAPTRYKPVILSLLAIYIYRVFQYRVVKPWPRRNGGAPWLLREVHRTSRQFMKQNILSNHVLSEQRCLGELLNHDSCCENSKISLI